MGKFPLVAFCGLLLFVAILLAEGMSQWFMLLLLQLVAIALLTEIAYRHLPQAVAFASEENCFRMDGSLSERRKARELKAKSKVRTDLFALFLLIAISGNWLAVFVHSQIIPLPLAVQALSVFSFDAEDWHEDLKSLRVADTHSDWYRSQRQVPLTEVDAVQQDLWDGWPFLAALALAWVALSLIVLRVLYIHIVQEFYRGVQQRSHEYVTVDVTRLQS